MEKQAGGRGEGRRGRRDQELTPEQWRGLARLADVMNALDSTAKGRGGDSLAGELSEARDSYHKLRDLQTFVEQHLADEWTAGAVDAMRLWQEHGMGDAIRDLLITVGHLHRAGVFAFSRRLADYIQAYGSEMDIDALVSELIAKMKANKLDRVGRLGESLDHAMEDADRDAPHLGGTTGLFHLLRDKEVQKGLRALAILPNYVMRPASAQERHG